MWTREGGIHNPTKFADVLYGWSLIHWGVKFICTCQVQLFEEGHGRDESVDGGPVQAVPVQHKLAHLEADGVRVARERLAEEVVGEVEELEVGEGADEQLHLRPLPQQVVRQVQLRDVAQPRGADRVAP